MEYAYDDFDRLTQVTYPEPGYTVFHEYDVFGYHRRSRSQRAPCSLSESMIDWEWVEADPAGNVKRERMGNGAETTRGYQKGTYRPEAIQTLAGPGAAAVQSLDFVWSDGGDLELRTDYNAGETEVFTYDDAHRLETWSWGGNTFSAHYDPLGNITSKNGETYTYTPATDRLISVGSNSYTYDDNGSVLTDGQRALTWTAGNKVRTLVGGGMAWSMLYDADGARVVREDMAANESTYSVGSSYELRMTGTDLEEARISVMGATGRVVAEVFAERTELEENELWELRKKYVHDDHLGSAHVVTDREGAVESNVLYGPWGRARDGANWNMTLSQAALDELPVGYTGHQPELDSGLINMRGRMYDPAIGRFLSVDPVIEDTLEVGTWNAYSYVQNRPLSLVDPTGMASKEPIDEDGPSFHEPTGDDVADDLLDILRRMGGDPISDPMVPKANEAPDDEVTTDEEGAAVEDAAVAETGSTDSEEARNLYPTLHAASQAAAEEVRDQTTFRTGAKEYGTIVFEANFTLFVHGTAPGVVITIPVHAFSYLDPWEGDLPSDDQKEQAYLGFWDPMGGQLPDGAEKKTYIHSHPEGSGPSPDDIELSQKTHIPGVIVHEHTQLIVFPNTLEDGSTHTDYPRDPTFH